MFVCDPVLVDGLEWDGVRGIVIMFGRYRYNRDVVMIVMNIIGFYDASSRFSRFSRFSRKVEVSAANIF